MRSMRPSFMWAHWPSSLLSKSISKCRCRARPQNFGRLKYTSQVSTNSRDDNAYSPSAVKQGPHPPAHPSPRHFSPDGTFAPAQLTPKRGRPGPPPRCMITTLDPARLDSSCFLDVSGVTYNRVYDRAAPDFSSLRLLSMEYIYKGTAPRRFPPATRGFLYFHPDEQNPLGSQIRFRVTQNSDPACGFASGHDLMYGSGYVWHIPLAHVTKNPTLRDMLLRDGLVDDALLGKLQAHYPSSAVPRRLKRGISALSQPFLLELKQSVLYLTVHVMGKDQCCRTNGPLTYYTEYGKYLVYAAGSALCRLERSTLPQHAGRRIVVMRLLKIVRPPKRRLDVPPTCDVNVPVEGELFARGQRVWYRDVGKPGKGAEILRLLYDAPNDGEPASGQSS